MVDKRIITPQGTPPDGMFPWPQPLFEQLYNNAMDASFAALGRSITLHLPPERHVSSGLLQSNSSALQYNPFNGRAPRSAPNIISTTKQPATEFVHRDVTYVAHILHGPRDTDDSGGISLLKGQVQLTTVIESLPHVNACETATIDGIRFRFLMARQIGLQEKRYIISTWQVLNEIENA